MKLKPLTLAIAAGTLFALAACNRHSGDGASPAGTNGGTTAGMPSGEAVEKKVDAAVDSTTEAVDDTVVTTKVKAALLAESSLKSGDIKVTTNQGTVSLSGSVATAEQKARAEQVAMETKGVSRVDNQLSLSK